MARTIERVALAVLWTIVATGGGILWGHYYANASAELSQFHRIEQRQREIFCEQALFNGVMKKCKAFKSTTIN